MVLGNEKFTPGDLFNHVDCISISGAVLFLSGSTLNIGNTEYDLKELTLLYRLIQVATKPVEQLHLCLISAFTGGTHEDQLYISQIFVGIYLTGKLPAVHSGHQQVDQTHIEGMLMSLSIPQ